MSKFQENSLNNQNSNSQNQNSPTQNNSPSDQEPNLMTILSSVLTPLIPVVVAKLTGQKLPVANITPNNDQNSLQQLTPVLQNMINTQNLLLQEIILLKRNEQNIANGFQSLRLTHEKKQVEFNQNQENHE